MLTLKSTLKIPVYILSTTVDDDAVLLNTQNNKYYSLDEVGARLWYLLGENTLLKDAYAMILKEYEVSPAQLEEDLLELLTDFRENGLVEIVEP